MMIFLNDKFNQNIFNETYHVNHKPAKKKGSEHLDVYLDNETDRNEGHYMKCARINSNSKKDVLRISLTEPIYIIHNTATQHEDRLNKSERDDLISILKAKSIKYPKYNVWQCLCMHYNESIKGTSLDTEFNRISYSSVKDDMPDYKKLPIKGE